MLGKERTMKNRKYVWKIFGTATLCCLCLPMIFSAGCEKKPEMPAPATADQEKTETEALSIPDSNANKPAATIPGVNYSVCPHHGVEKPEDWVRLEWY